MRIKIEKWDDSLAVRIPDSFAAEAKLFADEAVDLSIQNGKLVITALRRRYQLTDLLASINEDNQHEEHEYMTPSGEEYW